MRQRMLGLLAVAALVVASVFGIASMIRTTRSVIDRNNIDDSEAAAAPAAPANPRGLIAFAQNGRIVVAAPDGTSARFITAGPGDHTPVWSPDGKRIAFGSGQSEGRNGLFVTNADGTGEHQVASVAERNSPPTWSPDGTRLAYHDLGSKDAPGLYIAQADGSGARRIFAGTVNQPGWSPDGKSIAFTHNVKPTAGGLFVISADGQAEASAVVGGVFSAVSWSPDGTRVAVRGVRWQGAPKAVSSRQPVEQVLVYEVASGRDTELTAEASGGNWSPQWSPDGKSVMYVGGKDGAQTVMIVPTGAGQPRMVFMSTALVRPVWSPDGSELAVGIPESGTAPAVVSVVRADGRGSSALAPGESPAWGGTP